MKLKLKIVSSDSTLSMDLGSCIEPGEVSISFDDSPTNYRFWVRDGMAVSRINALLNAIAPFAPAVATDRRLADAGVDALLSLGHDQESQTEQVEVNVASASAELAAGIVADLNQSGFSTRLVSPVWTEQSMVIFGTEVDDYSRDLILWKLRRRGIEVRQLTRGKDSQVTIVARPLEHSGAQRLFPVEVRCDDPVLIEQLQRDGLAGFTVVPEGRPSKGRFELVLGPMRSPEFASERVELEREILTLLRAGGIDLARYPLRIKKVKTAPELDLSGRVPRIRSTTNRDLSVPAVCVLHLPIAACKAGELRPYAGDFAERLEIELRSDCNESCAPLARTLREQGLVVIERPLQGGGGGTGLQVEWGLAESCPRQKRTIHEIVVRFLSTAEIPTSYRLAERIGDKKSPRVRIDMPIAAARVGSLPDRRGEGFDFRLQSDVPESWEAQVSVLRSWAFDEIETDKSESVLHRHTRGGRIRYGGAPRGLLEEIADVFRREGVSVTIERVWPEHDNDIWLDIEPHPRHETRTSQECPPVAAKYSGSKTEVPPGGATVHPMIETGANYLVFAGQRIPRRQDVAEDDPLLPIVDTSEYCLDAPTVSILNNLVASMRLRQPVLLEGATSTSKTSSINFLAHLCRQPVLQLNLNGQSDTGELCGRFAPRVQHDRKSTWFDRWLEAILGAGRDKRTSPWQWIDGVVVRAMQEGIWLILDEVNLADSQVLERLNPVMERNPRLLLSERDGRLIAGEQVHPEFRVFATMNPAEYAGRSVLSPAWRNRFGIYRYCFEPTEHDYLHMLRYLLYGEQPSVALGSQWVRGPNCPEPAYRDLGAVDEIRSVIAGIARFHASMVGIAGALDGDGTAGLAVRRKERPIYTRRDLLNLLDYLSDELAIQGNRKFSLGKALDEAIALYYVNRLDSAEDRDTVRSLQEANGLTAETVAQVTEPQKQFGDSGLVEECSSR